MASHFSKHQRDKILVIDDDEQALRLMKRRLEQSGYENILLTALPSLGLELFQAAEPDLLILDLNMPEMDGIGVLEALGKMHPEQLARTPVIVLTGESADENKMKVLGLGARDFLSKPFDAGELILRVHGNLEVRSLLRKLEQHSEELDTRVRQRTAELENANAEIIQRLTAAAEYRDDDTGDHILRISGYCGLVARALNLPEEECSFIERASPMHDVGKIGIPDAILLKPGKLTPEEWEVMKTHTTVGANLLSGSSSPLVKLAETIALTHHEKWNGNGYPIGIKGEEIPIAGRIVAVCDVFDALVSQRPYKPAWEIERALEVLRADSGTHFDPNCVDAFFQVLSSILRVKDEFGSRKGSSQIENGKVN